MPNQKLTVSVVMCTHNGMEFIQEQLVSIFDQTLFIDELIISDDDSSDGTFEYIDQFIRNYIEDNSKASSLHYKLKRNIPALKVAKNFESALVEATGDLIFLSDQDDIWLPRRVEKMVNLFVENTNLTLAFSDTELIDSDGSSIGITGFQALRVTKKEISRINSLRSTEVLLRRNLVTGAATVFRRELLEIAFPIPSNWLHDEWLALIASLSGEIEFLGERLVRYRQHEKNQVGLKKPNFRFYISRLIHSREQRNKNLLDRAKSMSNHPFFLRNSHFVQISKEKLTHEISRSVYPKSNFMRIIPVIKEAKSGRYVKFGLGLQDIVRDIIQKT